MDDNAECMGAQPRIMWGVYGVANQWHEFMNDLKHSHTTRATDVNMNSTHASEMQTQKAETDHITRITEGSSSQGDRGEHSGQPDPVHFSVGTRTMKRDLV